MARRHEEARIPVYLNDEQAKSALRNLQHEADQWRRKMHKAMSAGDMKGMKDAEREMRKANKQASKLKRTAWNINSVLDNLSTASYNDLNKVLTQLNKEQRAFNRGTKKYISYTKDIKRVRKELSRYHREMKEQRGIFSRSADFVNRYWSILSSGVAIITGVAFSAKEMVKGLLGLDDALSDVMKTTGMTRKEVRQMYTDFRYLNTRTPRRELLKLAEEAGRLGKKSRKDIEDFVEVANKIKVALGDDLGGESEKAIREVGKLVEVYKVGDQYGTNFKESLNKVGSAINEVSANSNSQAAYQIGYLKRMGGISQQAKISSANILGYASSLDQLGQAQEMAATAHGKTILNMFKDSATYAGIAKMKHKDFYRLLQTDANEAFLEVLEGLNGNNEGLSIMSKKLEELGVDGSRAVQVLAAMASNTKMIRSQQKMANKAMEDGTSLTNEYTLKNNNLAGSVAKIGRRLKSVFINSKLLGGVERIVGAFARWMDIPIGKKLKKERMEMNKLVMKITSLNEGDATRLKLIKELISKYPQYYGQIDAATISNDRLLSKLREVNRQMIRQIYISGRKEELAKLQENAADKLSVEMKYQERLEHLKAQYFSKMGKAQQKQFTADFDFFMHHFQRINSSYTSNVKAAMAVTKWLKKNKLSKEYKGGLDYSDMTALNISYNEWREAYKKKYRARSEAESEYRKIDEYEKKWGLDKTAPVNSSSAKSVKDIAVQDDDLQRSAFASQFNSNPKRTKSIIKDFEKKSRPELETEEEQEVDRKSKYILDKHKETLDYRLLLNQSMYDAGIIGEQEYQDKLTELTKEAEEKRLRIKQKKAEQARELAQLGVNFITSLMQFEIEKAGDNEEKKKAVRKKYADAQFAVTAAQIVADTAAAIMKGYAQLGPVGGKIAAILLGATGLFQLGIANEQRKKTKSLKRGGYTGWSLNDDEITGEHHANEFVVSAPAVRNPFVKKHLDIIDIAQKRGNVGSLTALDFMDGIAPVASAPVAQTNSVGISTVDEEMKYILVRATRVLERLEKFDPVVSIEKFEREKRDYDDILNNSKF